MQNDAGSDCNFDKFPGAPCGVRIFCLKQIWLKVGNSMFAVRLVHRKHQKRGEHFAEKKMLKRVANTFELCPFSNCYWNWTDRVTAVVLWPCHGYEDAAVFPPAPSGLVWCTSSSPPRNPTQVRQHLAREPMKTRLWSDITVHHSSSRSCPGRQGDSITVCHWLSAAWRAGLLAKHCVQQTCHQFQLEHLSILT